MSDIPMEHSSPISPALSREEAANAFTHGFGVLACLIGIPVLLERGATGPWHHQMGLLVFSGSLLLVYLSSTIYHAVGSRRLKGALRRLDHIAIYFLIAGTHTPFLVYYLHDGAGPSYLALLWTMVVLGTLYKLFLFGRLKLLSVFYYLAMGWMAVFTLPAMLNEMSDATLYWIIAGGFSYTLGVIFFLWERLPYHHAIWHLFVMGGSFGHFMAVWVMV